MFITILPLGYSQTTVLDKDGIYRTLLPLNVLQVHFFINKRHTAVVPNFVLKINWHCFGKVVSNAIDIMQFIDKITRALKYMKRQRIY